MVVSRLVAPDTMLRAVWCTGILGDPNVIWAPCSVRIECEASRVGDLIALETAGCVRRRSGLRPVVRS
jgi:hypothetical protein